MKKPVIYAGHGPLWAATGVQLRGTERSVKSFKAGHILRI